MKKILMSVGVIALGALATVSCSDRKTVNINDQVSFDAGSNQGSFKLTTVPSGFVYAGNENATSLTYSITGVPDNCSVISFGSDGSELAGSGNSGTTYALYTGEYLKVTCTAS